MEPASADRFTKSLVKIVDGAAGLIDLAPELGVPKALGLSDEEWLERRLHGPVRLSREERRRIVAANPQVPLRQLAAATGASKSTIADDRAVQNRTAASSDNGHTENGTVQNRTNGAADAVADAAEHPTVQNPRLQKEFYKALKVTSGLMVEFDALIATFGGGDRSSAQSKAAQAAEHWTRISDQLGDRPQLRSVQGG